MGNFAKNSELVDKYLIGHGSLRNILSELLETCASLKSYDWISSIPQKLRISYDGDSEIAQVLRLDKDEFVKRIAGMSASKALEAKRLYDEIFPHILIIKIFHQENFYGEKYNGFVLDEIVYMANWYIEDSELKSKSFESLLLKILIYTETISFARQMHFFVSLRASYLRAALQSASFLLNELVWLFFTGVVSNYLSNSLDSVNYWIIFSTITLIRWLSPISFMHTKKKEEAKKLLSDMAYLCEIVSDRNFNSHRVKDLLYELDRRGAYFHKIVYDLLDKRIQTNQN